MSKALFIQLSVSHFSLISVNAHLLVLRSVDLSNRLQILTTVSFTFGSSALIQGLIIRDELLKIVWMVPTKVVGVRNC